MKENSVFFPLTNPSQRLDQGRRLAGVGTRLPKSQNNGSFGLNQAFIWRMSGKRSESRSKEWEQITSGERTSSRVCAT
jgi:hypothetical protein